MNSAGKFNLGGKKKVINVKQEQYESGGPSTQPIIPIRRPRETSPVPSTTAAARGSTRRRTMQPQDWDNTQPVTTRETKQSQRRATGLDDSSNMDYLMSFREQQLRSKAAAAPHRQDYQQQQRAYAPDNRYDDARPDIRNNIQHEKNKMYEDRVVVLMDRLKQMVDAKDTEDIITRFKAKEALMDRAYEDLNRCIQDMRGTRFPGDTEQIELVTNVQRENSELKAQIRELQEELKQSAKHPSQAQQELEIYLSLTGLLVQRIEQTQDDVERNIDAGKQYTCLMKNELGVLEFNLILPYDKSKRVVYIPLTEEKTYPKLWESLPEFLIGEIDFSKEELPIFFWRLSSCIHLRR